MIIQNLPLFVFHQNTARLLDATQCAVGEKLSKAQIFPFSSNGDQQIAFTFCTFGYSKLTGDNYVQAQETRWTMNILIDI